MPHLLTRIFNHKKAVYSLLPAGIARRHRGNPAASLKLHQLYATPVLLSGLAALILSKKEIKILDSHYKLTLQNILKLYEKTPSCIVYYLAGSLPVSAILHLRVLTLFSMICLQKDDPLHKHAKYVLLHSESCSKSWFIMLRSLCLQYGLPHPFQLLDNPLPRSRFKRLIECKVYEYWHRTLRAEVASLSSLCFFNPLRHSLLKPHPLWSAAASNWHEVNKSTFFARMINGRYRTESVTWHWSGNKEGFCMAPTCRKTLGDLTHLLLLCPALESERRKLQQLWIQKASPFPELKLLLTQLGDKSLHEQMSFILDPSSNPIVVSLTQVYGQPILDTIFFLVRTYTYTIHMKKQAIIAASV